MTRVTLNALTKRYGGAEAPALDALSLDVASGEVLALLGPSGCGKTTAMKLIAGLLAPTAGDVAFDGRSVAGLAPEDRGAVMMFQDHLLFPSMSVGANVGFGLRMRRRPRAEVEAAVEAMLARVRLPGFAPRRPQELSGGQQQRVALARALIVAPRVLLLDEPLSNLDPHLREEMGDLILDLQREAGVTTILVTHDRDEAATLGDRIAILFDGRLAQTGPAATLHRRPASLEVARFLGARNFIEGAAEGGVFSAGDLRLTLPPDAPSGPGALTFAPEAPLIGGSAGGSNTVDARLIAIEDLGHRLRIRAQLGAASVAIIARPDETEGLEVGAPFAVTLPPDAIWLVRPAAEGAPS